MITTRQPETWQELQEGVAGILRECGFSVEVEKKLETVRGTVEIDVFAQEDVKAARILCCANARTGRPVCRRPSFTDFGGDCR
jgi:hypothetical protein